MPDPVTPDLPMVENQGPTINLGPDQFRFDPVEAANQSAGISPQPLHDPNFASDPERDTVRAVLNDRNNLGGKLPQAVTDSKTDDNPQDFRDMAANIKALSFYSGKDPAEISPNYEQEKQNFVKSEGWDMPNSEGAFNSQLRDFFNTQDARQQALDDLHSRAILDAAKAPGATDALQTSWQEWNTQHASALAGVPEAQAFSAWKKGYWNNLQQLQGEHQDLAQKIVDLYGNLPKGEQESQSLKNQASLAIEGLKAPIGFAGDQPALKAEQEKEARKSQLLDALAALPKEERQKVYQRAAALEKVKNPESYGIATSLYSMGQDLGRHVDWLSPDALDLSTSRGRIALELKHAARDTVNPLLYSDVNPWDATEKGLPVIGTKVGQGLAGAAPTIAAFALTGKYGGLAYMLAQTTLENRDRLLVANETMTPKEALSFGYLMAVPEVALMSISFMGLKGAFPSLEKALADWGAGKMFMANTAVGGVAFSASGLAGSLADSAINALNAEWNQDASVMKGLKETLLNAPQDFAMAAAFALMHVGQKPDAKAGKRQAEEAMADAQKPGAAKVVTTADGSKVIMTTNEKGEPKEVFRTKDPETAVHALEIVQDERRQKEANQGNDWTTATEDKPSTHTITVDIPETTDTPEAKQEGNGPDWQYKDEASQSWWQERDRLQAAYDATAPHTPERQAARQALHDYEDRRLAGGPDADISQRHDANNLTASFFLDEEGNGMQSGNMDGATWSGGEIINSRGERVRQVTLPDGATGFLRLDHTPDHILEHIDANAEPRAEEKGDLTKSEADGKSLDAEAETSGTLANTADASETGLPIRTLNSSLASENKSTRVTGATPDELSKLSLDPKFQLADQLAGIFNKRIIVYSGDENDPNGITSQATGLDQYIFLKLDGARPHLFTLAHELWHHLEADYKELAKSLRKELAPLIKNWAQMNGKYQSYGYKPHRFFDEHVADFLGDSFQDPDFLNNLRKRNPEAFADFATKALEWLNDVFEKLKGWTMGGTDHIRDIQSARDMLAEGLDKYLNRDDSPIERRDSPQWWKTEPRATGERQIFTDDPIIAYLNENRIRSKSEQEKRNKSQGIEGAGEYDGVPKLPPAHSSKIYGGSQSVDQAHQALIEEGYMPEDSTVDDLWNHIAKASESAMKQTAAEKAEFERQKAEAKADKELADLRENDPVEYRKRLAEMEPAEQKRNEYKQALERMRRMDREDRNNFQNARESDQKENEETFSLENPQVQAYLDLANVPEEKRDQAGEAFSQVAKASTVPYEGRDVSTRSGVDGDKLRQAREEQAAAYRGLLKGDAEAVKSAIENGVPLSKLIGAYATGETTPFSIHGAIINSPADLAAHNLAHRTPFFESLKVAILDNSNQVIHSELVSIGSLNESIAHPREIMRAVERGIQRGSDLGRKIQGWMLMHNHPSGDPSPSEADRRLTRRLDEVAKMMESPLLDHVITNGETYFSFNQAGLHGEDVKRDPKLKPKLQTIPKPEDLKAGTMADWEATPASEAVRVDRADVVRNIRATLQTADPGMIHVLNLNTRYGLISVDRHPLDVSPGEILKQSSKHGTYAIALSFPETTPEGMVVDTQGATAAWRPFVRKMTEAGTLYQLPLVDAVAKEFSWRESGLLEQPGKYESADSVSEEKTHFQASRADDNPEPPTLKDRMLQTASRIKDSISDLPKDNDFRRSLLAWSGRNQRSTLEITRAMKEIETRVPDSQEREAITNFIEAGGSEKLLQHWADGSINPDSKAAYERALNLSPEARAIAEKVSETFRILESRGEKWGIDMGHREGYVPHIYKQGDPAPPLGSNSKRLSEFFKFSQERTFNNYFDAEQNGYDAQTKDIGKLLGLYLNDMNNAINSRRFVAEMHQGKADDGRNLLSARGSGQTVGKEEGNTVHLVYPDKADDGTQDYKKIDQPALHDWTFAGKDADGNMILVKGDLDVHPDVADHLNNVLSTSGISKWLKDRSGSPFSNALKSTVQGLITAQSYAKGTGLSFSPFHQVQEGVHAIGHQINPLDVPVIDGKNPEQLDAAAHGLMIAHDRISQDQFQEGLGHGGKNLITLGLRKLGWGFSEAAADKVDGYNDWLFGKYIPGLKFKTYQHILERNMERFAGELESGQASEWQIKNLSAQQANAAYGHLNYAEIGRNPTLQHIFQLVALAPDFLEARAKFVAQAGKGLIGGAARVATSGKQGSKVGYEQLSAIALLAATQVIGGRIANKLINDEWDMKHPFEIKVGNTYYGFRSVPEDIFKLATDWRAFVGGRISPLFGKFIQEGLFGQNYRHEKTSIADAISDIFSGMVPGPFMAFARYLTEQAPAPVQKAIKDLPGTARNNSISPLEQILSSTGLQVHRFSPINSVYPLVDKWIKSNYPELRDGKSTFPVSKFQQLRYALEDNDTQKAQREVENLKAAGFSDEKINKGFKLSMTHPWTGSKELDQEFYKAQDDDTKRVIDAGNDRRKIILDRFNAIPR